jgi:phospholipid N-methyltransferase
MRERLAEYRVFWREFRQAYHTTGAVLPSGRALSRALARYVREGDSHLVESLDSTELAEVRDSDKAVSEKLPYVAGRRILEVGPGTGAVTNEIVRAMRPSDHLDLVERNEQFVAHLQARFEDSPLLARANVDDQVSLIHASVEDVPEDKPYDVIVSGLPLNNFSLELVEQILEKLQRLLAPGGTLSFFEYVAVRRAKSLVSKSAERERLRGITRIFTELFSSREIARDLVLANVPPAWVHHVRRGAGG